MKDGFEIATDILDRMDREIDDLEKYFQSKIKDLRILHENLSEKVKESVSESFGVELTMPFFIPYELQTGNYFNRPSFKYIGRVAGIEPTGIWLDTSNTPKIISIFVYAKDLDKLIPFNPESVPDTNYTLIAYDTDRHIVFHKSGPITEKLYEDYLSELHLSYPKTMWSWRERAEHTAYDEKHQLILNV